jgi:DNA-binding IclR family transcriptional regulator
MSMALNPAHPQGGVGVQSVEVGLMLLRPLIDAGEPLNLTTIARAIGFSTPKARRYLVSLIRVGLVEQDPQTGRYGFGTLAFELGINALGLLDHNKLARSALSELENETGHSTCLVVWGTAGPTVIAVESSPRFGTVFLAMRVGSTLPLLTAASGRIFLAHLSRERTRGLVAKERRTLNKTSPAVEDIIQEVRCRGYATSKDATVPGISALSAPVFDHDGKLLYALTLFGPTASLDVSRKSEILQSLQVRAVGLSRRIGFKPT